MNITYIHRAVTHATIGAGNITVGGDTNPELAGLNRDVDNSQEITRDEITGALDGSVTVDNRVFTESGRDQIADQHENLGENLAQIGDGLRNNIVTKSIENAITDDTKNIIDTVGDYIEQDRQMTELQQKRQDLVQALNGLTNYDSPEAQAVLQQVADLVAGTDGFAGDLKLANIDGNVVGFAYQSNDGSVKNISLNLANIDMTDPNALMNAIYHETTNFDQHTKNEQTAINRGNTGAGIFDLKNYGNENTNTMDNGQWLSNYGHTDTIQNGSLSLVSDAINSSTGNGIGKGDLISIGTLATLAVASYYGGKYAGSKIEQQSGESYGDAKKRFQENNPLFAIDEKIGELVITGVAGGADYISGDLQLGTNTLVKVGEGYEWLDNKLGGNLEETLDATAVIGSVVATAKVAGKIDNVAKAGNKIVWDNIKPVLENNPNTMIPKSFELTLSNSKKIYVAPNATKHLAESPLASVSQHGVEKAGLNAQQMLKSLESSINAATQHGIIYDKPIKSGNWELIFSPGRNPGDLPVLKHAVPNF